MIIRHVTLLKAFFVSSQFICVIAAFRIMFGFKFNIYLYTYYINVLDIKVVWTLT